jgi:hypothetical protein
LSLALQSFGVEDSENIANYEFTEGYLKYFTEPAEDMHLSIQLGRENKTVGYGYGSKLILSGDNPALDFIGFDFNYGIVKFTSIHGSTVGDFSSDINERYTKYWAFNRFKLSFENLFDIGIGETIVYSGRGIELVTCHHCFINLLSSQFRMEITQIYILICKQASSQFRISGYFLSMKIFYLTQNLDIYK